MTPSVRVRFAPSPTGPLHIGGVRTALFNYLFAKQHKGTFVLRIEDTDQTRYVSGAEPYITEALNWLDIPYDEGPEKPGLYGPYRQSERKTLYNNHITQLIDAGHAYYAFDSAEDLANLRALAESQGETFTYGVTNRKHLNNALAKTHEEVQQLIAPGLPYVVRFKTPENRTLTFTDLIRGEVSIQTSVLDDKILFKSDGMPTYHFANVVDDHLMKISHVIRGEEWLPSLALHLLLYESFGWAAPEFAHLPLILKPSGKGKLSKRDGDSGGFPVFPLAWKTPNSVFSGYREQGYLPEAVLNILAFLGWNPGTEQEVFSKEELVRDFDLTRVQKSGAKFDPEKARWFQNHYFQNQPKTALVASFVDFAQTKGVYLAGEKVPDIIELIQNRASFVVDLWTESQLFFQAPKTFDPQGIKKAIKPDTVAVLTELQNLLNSIDDFTVETLSDMVKTWAKEANHGLGSVMMPLRLALVGSMQGPDVFAIMSLLGPSETCERIAFARAFLS
ncbi:MAG: glutamate--tRNA ligase [Flavobacteriaceae bacterium]|nr:glutamate--tRNA ligase [Flavobacteriaceae bacterium]MDG1962589.1 glutamate--tRNA ligase [Flavobacteriaceae bacterium]